MPDNLKTYTVKIKNREGLILPKLGDPLASGYDITASEPPEIVGEEILPGVYRNISYIQYRTGIYLEPIDRKEQFVDNDFTTDILSFLKNSEEKEEVETYLQCFIYPRSSITKYNLILKNGIGVCDAGYRGEYLIRFAYLPQPEDFVPFEIDKSPCFGVRVNIDKIYKKNERIAQLIFAEISPRIRFEVVDNLGETERGSGSFGSTGR